MMVKHNRTGILKYPDVRHLVLINLGKQQKSLFKKGVKVIAIRTHPKSDSLDKFTIVNPEVRLGKIGDTIGRNNEIKSVARVLQRRTKNSSVLVRTWNW